MKLLICGYARHGKDTFADLLCDRLGLTKVSSSEVALDKIIYPVLKDKYNYQSREECFEDRINHRSEWYDLIREYNEGDDTRLARDIYELCDVYVGLRSYNEFMAIKDQQLFDLSIWIDASDRLPEESRMSCTINKNLFDVVINNNGTLDDIVNEVDKLSEVISKNL